MPAARWIALLLMALLSACASGTLHLERVHHARYYVLRLQPGDDLRESLERFTHDHGLRAAFIVTCAGSLEAAAIRFADKADATTILDKFEIVSLTGTLSPDGPHLHIALSDSSGHTVGGHVVKGCRIYTTAEIVIGELDDVGFTRELDPRTRSKELVVH